LVSLPNAVRRVTRQLSYPNLSGLLTARFGVIQRLIGTPVVQKSVVSSSVAERTRDVSAVYAARIRFTGGGVIQALVAFAVVEISMKAVGVEVLPDPLTPRSSITN
jgi:hypothetical protein